MEQNWFDIVILVILIFSFIHGYISGLVMQLASLIGLLCCAFFAGKVAETVSPYIISFTNAPDYAILPLSYLLAFVIIMIIFLVIGKTIEGFIRAIKLNILNRLSGSVFSVFKWLFLTSIVLNLIVGADQQQQVIKSDVKESSHTYPYIEDIAPYFIPFLDFDFFQSE